MRGACSRQKEAPFSIRHILKIALSRNSKNLGADSLSTNFRVSESRFNLMRLKWMAGAKSSSHVVKYHQ
jgi:hypothetical protein